MKKFLKRSLAALLAVVMVVGAAPLAGFVGIELPRFSNPFEINTEAATSGKCGDNVTWNFEDSTGTLTILGKGEMYDYEHASSLPYINYYSSVKKVIIEHGITRIGNYAFCDTDNARSYISSVVIPDSVISIGDYAFVNCDYITEITFPNSVTSIGDKAFAFCDGLTNIMLSDGIVSIGENSFECCDNVTSVQIGKGLKNLKYIFEANDDLVSITVDPENSEFSNDKNGVLFNKDKTTLIRFPEENTISNYAVLDSVTNIGDLAFSGCHKLNCIFIPDSVTNIGNCAFINCDSLTSISIPDSVTSIGESCFQSCYSLTDVIIGKGITSISQSAFMLCENLKNIEISDTLICIENSAFSACTSLELINIPSSVTSIGDRAFGGCYSLKNIEIPGCVTNIGRFVFEECENLTKITVDPINTKYSSDENGILFNKEKTSVYYYPEGIKINTYEIPEGVQYIDNYAFFGNKRIKCVIIPSGVISIGFSAFSYCENLSKIVIGNGQIKIRDYAFEGCLNLVDLCFTCSEEEINNIKIYYGNDVLYNANLHFNYVYDNEIDVTNLNLNFTYPSKDSTKISSDDDLILTFNQPIEDSFYFEKAEKEISIRNYNTDEPVLVINDVNFLNYWSLIDFSGNTITFSGVLSKICPGEKYYVTISPGVISAEGDFSKTFAGINDKDEWTFTYSDESEKKGYNFEVYSSRSSFNMNKGETLNAKVVLTLNGDKCRQEGVSYAIGNSNIAKVKSMSHDESGTTFTIEALSYGVTTLDIIYKAGSLRESYIIKVADEKTVYYLEDIKGRNQDKKPFYTCGLYIDDLNYTESDDGRANVTFDVYNYSHCYGAVEVHDASGNLVNSEMIAMFNGEYNTDFVSYGTYVYKVGRDVFNGDFIDNDVYKTDVKTQKTSIDISVPKGGYIVITKNVSESMPCLLYNVTLLAIEAASSTAKIINNSKFKSDDEIIENIVQATAKKITWKEIAHILSSEAAKSIVKDFIKAGNEVNISAMLNATEGIYMNLDEIYKTFEIDWKELVISTIKDCAPDIAVEFATDFALDSIGGDIADLFFRAVGVGKYCEILMEVTDYTDVGGTYIYNSQKGDTRYSNKVIAKSDAIPDNVVFHSVLIKSGNIGDVYNGYTESYEEAELYDISLIKNGNKIQPNGKVQVQIPIPSGWDASKISVHHETSYREYEKLDVTIEDGYIIFYTDSFSNFIIVNGDVKLSTPKVDLRIPSITTIKYGDRIVLHADLSEELPDGWYIEWTAYNGNFDYNISPDGTTCTISPNKSGSTTFTATVYDSQGNAVSKDEQTMTSKAGFFDKIIAFFKKLFGLTKVIPQALKYIY